MDKIRLNKEQQQIFDLFWNKHTNIFLTGKGGTGKSYLTRYIIDRCKAASRNVLVCAPTGVAATNIDGATIHRTFCVPVRPLLPDEYFDPYKTIGEMNFTSDKARKKVLNRLIDKVKVIESADVLIIDEISMCRIDLFSWVCNTLLEYNPTIQLLVVGDFYQLPPVGAKKEQERLTFTKAYGNYIYAFQSHLWNRLGLRTMELQTSMRQKDATFIRALDQIREGVPSFDVFTTAKEMDLSAVTICPRNEQASQINSIQLHSLSGQDNPLITIQTKTWERPGFRLRDSDYPVDKELQLCKGAMVVLLVNDGDGAYVNGSTAEVVSINVDDKTAEPTIGVRLTDSGTVTLIQKNTWSIEDYAMERDPKTGKNVVKTECLATICQFPLRLAWGITIHKSQGQTYDKVNIKADGFFAEGQMYVALSRCRSLQGLKIIGELKPSELKCAEVVCNFMQMGENFKPQLPANTTKDLAFPDVPANISKAIRQLEEEDKAFIKALKSEMIMESGGSNKPLPTKPASRSRHVGRPKAEYNKVMPSQALRVPGEMVSLIQSLIEKGKRDGRVMQSIVLGLKKVDETV